MGFERVTTEHPTNAEVQLTGVHPNSSRDSERVVEAIARARGITVRVGTSEDMLEIALVAEHSFPNPPGWMDVPEQAARYRREYPLQNAMGVQHLLVTADTRGRVCGYCIYQTRPTTAYLVELAAHPRDAQRRLRNAGVLLLAASLLRVSSHGIKIAKLAVAAADRYHDTGRGRADLVAYYSRFGFVQGEAAGERTADGLSIGPTNVLMIGSVQHCLSQVFDYLEGAPHG